MIDLGTVRPGSTIIIPFTSFDKDDGSAITMTNYAAADILVYKDGGTTERASTSGFTATTDFDTKTGKHLAVIDLSDNTTAGFWNAGSEYLVAIDSVTIDAVTTGGWVARFRIGYREALYDTTIATLASQTSFTLTTGPAEDNALVGQWCIIHDIASAVQFSKAVISAYTGSTKTVTLIAAPTFTVAAGDNISIMGPMPLQPTTFGRTLDVSTGGEAGIDWANVGTPGSTVNLSATTTNVVNTATATTTVNGLAAGVVTAASIAASALNGKGDWNIGKTGYSLTQTFPTNFASMAISVGGAVTVGTNSDKTGYSLTAVTGLGNQTADITGSLSGSVGSVTGAVGSVTGAVGSVTAGVTVAVGGIDSTSFAAGAVDAAAIAADAIGSSELAQSAAQEIADEVLNRDIAGGASGGTRNVRSALRAIRNKVAVAAGTMTVYQEDDTTAAWTAAVTTTAGNPVSAVDPT